MKKNGLLIVMVVVLALVLIANVTEIIKDFTTVNWSAYIGIYAALTCFFAAGVKKKIAE